MEMLFENKYTRDAQWAKDSARYIYFRRPSVIIMDAFFALYFAWGVYDWVFSGEFYFLRFFIPLYWCVFVFALYCKNSRLVLERDFEVHGRAVEVVLTVGNKEIEQRHSTGALYRLSFCDIKKVVQTKYFIYLWSKTNTLYPLKKDGFSVGNGEEFLRFVRNKGIKVSGKE